MCKNLKKTLRNSSIVFLFLFLSQFTLQFLNSIRERINSLVYGNLYVILKKLTFL